MYRRPSIEGASFAVLRRGFEGLYCWVGLMTCGPPLVSVVVMWMIWARLTLLNLVTVVITMSSRHECAEFEALYAWNHVDFQDIKALYLMKMGKEQRLQAVGFENIATCP